MSIFFTNDEADKLEARLKEALKHVEKKNSQLYQLRSLCRDYHLLFHWIPCVNKDCDNNGVISTLDSYGHIELQPCQWCHYRNALIEKYTKVMGS